MCSAITLPEIYSTVVIGKENYKNISPTLATERPKNGNGGRKEEAGRWREFM